MNNIDAFSLLKSINDENIYDFVNQVSTACFQEQDIYIGTKSGMVHKLENQRLDDVDELGFVTSLLASLELIKNCSVDQLEICSILNLIIALTNETVVFINESTLNIQQMNYKLRNVTALSMNEGVTANDEYVTEMCVGFTNKKLQLYQVSRDRLLLIKEINLWSIPVALSLDLDIICVASATTYKLINISTEDVTDLFMFDSAKMRPKIAKLPGNAGLLLRGPDGLGIFADANGTSQRPPIQWTSTIHDFVALRRHIIAMDKEFITIHSIGSQQQVQTIHYPNETAILAHSKNTVLIIGDQHLPEWPMVQLAPLSWSQQCNQYIARGLIDKATSIVYQQLAKSTLTEPELQKCSGILSVCGFHMFRQAQFRDAKIMLEKSNVDFREVINCYPNMLPRSYRFEPRIATLDSGFQLHSILDSASDPQARELQYKHFLLELLVEHRDSNLTRAFSQIVETVLVKLYVELEPQKLFHNFTMMLTDVDYDDLVEYLTWGGHHHACAMVMQWYGQVDKAVNVWSRLMKEEIQDPTFPGIDFLKGVLSNISDPNIIVRNIDWLLRLDPICTSEILTTFIVRFKNEYDLISILVTDEVMAHIEHYPDTLFDILFELCQNDLLQNNSQHDHLSQIFMRKLAETQSDERAFSGIRAKFQQFLSISDSYPAQKLLNQVQDFPVPLLVEKAWILGQMTEHESALKVIANQLRDFALAEKYCLLFERKNRASNSNLFLKLLSIYLTNQEPGFQAQYKDAALDLLDTQACKFDMKEVLTLLPDDWPLNRLQQFLLNSTVIRNQSCFTIKMKAGLEKAVNHRRTREARAIIQNNKLVLEEWEQLLCSHCGNNIDNCSFIKTQSGQLLHKHCYNCT